MAWFDYFDPVPPIGCHRPGCTGTLFRWQGQHSKPAGHFLWRQGLLSPVGQLVDEEIRVGPEKSSVFRLPANAAIEAYGANCKTCQALARFKIICETNSEGLWVSTKIEAKFAVGHVIEGWIVCANCYDAWQKVEGKMLYLCPTCESVIQDAGHEKESRG